jgi:hypothetical protein
MSQFLRNFITNIWLRAIVMFLFFVLVILFEINYLFDTKETQLLIGKIFSNSEKIKDIATRIETVNKTPLDEKRDNLLNTVAVSFHYVNKNEVDNFYNDYFKEPLIENLVSEVTNEVSGNIKAKLPAAIEAKAGGKDLKKWISTIKVPDISLNEKFRRYQRENILKNQVFIGLELLNIELTDIEQFDKLVSKLKGDYSFTIDENMLEKHRRLLKHKAAEKTLFQLEHINGWVLIDGKFKVSNTPDGFYKLIYWHPVNEVLARSDEQVVISTIVRKDAIESSVAGNYSQSIGQSIPIKLYGKVWQPLDMKAGIWEIQITPIAIY